MRGRVGDGTLAVGGHWSLTFPMSALTTQQSVPERALGRSTTMGMFKNLKQTVNSAKEMQADAMAMMEQANAPVDPNDPAFEPIHGISLDRYAQLTAALAKQNLAGIEQVEAWMTAQGVPEGKWAEVNQGWTGRMAGNAQVRNRYGVLYSQG
jgi:hypothetical protein